MLPAEPGTPPHRDRYGRARPDPGRHRNGRPGTTPLTPPGGTEPVWPARPPAARPPATRRPPPGPPARDQPPVSPPAAPEQPAAGQAGTGQAGIGQAGTGQAGTGQAAPGARVRRAGWDTPYSEEVRRPRGALPVRDETRPHLPQAIHARPYGDPAALPAVAGHGHGHTPAPPAGRRVRLLIAMLLVPCALATLVGVVLLWPGGGLPPTTQPAQQPVHAEVTAARSSECGPGGGGDQGCVALVVRMADGPRPGRDLVQVVPVEPGSPRFVVGDDVVLGWSGGDPNDPGSYQIVDFQRGSSLLWLAVIFAVAVLLLGRWRGLAALVALALSFGVLLLFVLPAILEGHDPLAVAIVGSCLIMFVVLYLTHGPSARTSTAVIGTLASLALIGVLGAAFSAAAKLTGLDEQTGNLIATLGTGVDARGLLLAGVVIGALGVLDDVTVTQTSAVWELRRADPGMGARALFAAAMRIGRDHVASAVNTLVLAYAGASLPLLLLFTLSGRALGEVVTAQDVATEVVRTLVGSIGLVASVPITTALAAAVASRESRETV